MEWINRRVATFLDFIKDENGASLMEYTMAALIIAAVGLLALLAMMAR
jgi:Flp pilus assembly pilin Flp